MSVLINEKLHSRRLKWRWPLSRQVTLSIGTLAVLLLSLIHISEPRDCS